MRHPRANLGHIRKPTPTPRIMLPTTAPPRASMPQISSEPCVRIQIRCTASIKDALLSHNLTTITTIMYYTLSRPHILNNTHGYEYNESPTISFHTLQNARQHTHTHTHNSVQACAPPQRVTTSLALASTSRYLAESGIDTFEACNVELVSVGVL